MHTNKKLILPEDMSLQQSLLFHTDIFDKCPAIVLAVNEHQLHEFLIPYQFVSKQFFYAKNGKT